MSGPWEKYQKSDTASGPWDSYKAKEPKKSQKLSAALEGFGEGATLGYLNNLQALADKPVTAIGNFLTGNNVEADDYVTARDSYNRRQDQLKEENPASFGAGQVAGTIASSIPVAKAAQGATMLARAGNAAKAGAAYGALQNTDEQEGVMGGFDLEDRAISAGVGALTGAGASVGTDLAVKGLSATGKAIANQRNKIADKLSKTAENLAENATGATRVQAEKFRDGSGRYLLDNKLVRFGDTAEDVAQRAGKAISKSEDAIDASLKALDAQGVRVSQDKIVSELQNQISTLSKDPSKSDVVRKLTQIVDDIIETGDSNITSSSAEQVKRGFNRMAKNWQDPEKGQAGKIAYRAYRDAVEDTASAANPQVAQTFKEAKDQFGRLAPIVDAAEKRARQLNQHPIGGLLDVTGAVAGGSVGGIPGAIAGSIGRRALSPRAASSAAVTFDSIAKKLATNPQMSRLAQVNPEAFRATVFSMMDDIRSELPKTMLKAADKDAPKKGPEKWVNDGADKLNQAGISQDQIEALRSTKQGRDLLIDASDATPNSKRMESVLRRVRTATNQGGQ